MRVKWTNSYKSTLRADRHPDGYMYRDIQMIRAIGVSGDDSGDRRVACFNISTLVMAVKTSGDIAVLRTLGRKIFDSCHFRLAMDYWRACWAA